MVENKERTENKDLQVSVIIPCYNAEPFLLRAIESVFSQTYKNWELILVNNNSLDRTEDILKAYETRYPGKIRVYFEEKKGAPAARNKGLEHANGEWIQFLDADDELLPNKISSQMKIAVESHPAIVASPYVMRGVKNGIVFEKGRVLEKNDFWKALILSQLGITSANLFNRNWVEQVNGWDESLVSSQEYDLMFRMLQCHPVVGFDPLIQTVIHLEIEESVSRNVTKERSLLILESRIGLRLRIREYLESKNLFTASLGKYLDAFIYRQVIEKYRYQPIFVLKKLGELQLRPPIKERLKGYYFMLKMDIKRGLKFRNT